MTPQTIELLPAREALFFDFYKVARVNAWSSANQTNIAGAAGVAAVWQSGSATSFNVIGVYQ